MVRLNGSSLTPNEVLEARVDWLTASIVPGYRQSILATRAADWQSRRIREGFSLKEFRWSGYLGESCDGITWGTREDGGMIRLSGDMAHQHALTALTFASNVSRLDLQVTLHDATDTLDHAGYAHRLALLDNRVKSGMTRTSIIRSTPSGSTCYIGSRSSDRYFRVYDKTAESEQAYPVRSWRWEIEYKKDRAYRVAQHILHEHGSPEAIRGVIETAFIDYGIQIPCHSLPRGWRDAGIRHETNDERRLAWLTSSIRPMIEKLLEGTDIQTVAEALGLQGQMLPREPINSEEVMVDGFPIHEPDSGSWVPEQVFGSGSGT